MKYKFDHVFNDYYCYILTVDNIPFYIGQGRGQRMQFHEWHAHGSKECSHSACMFIRAAEKLGHHIGRYKDSENMTREKSLQRESELIDIGHIKGWPLVNKPPAGPKGRKWTQDEREYRTAAITETWQDEGLREQQRKRQQERWSDPTEKTKQKERFADPAMRKKCGEANKGTTRKALTYPGFIAPDGTVYAPVHNLALFCKDHNLQKSNMCLVAAGKQQAHKGWTLYEPK